jgi:kumamolisin
LLSQAKAEGQAWFTASGDDGTDGCQDGPGNDVLSVDWPSASPYVISVGGTQISGGKEIAWAGSGGGQSEIVPKPAFQTGIGPYPNDGARDVPDVAALAGGPGVNTYSQGKIYASEGTSAAAPIWAGVWAVLDQAKGGTGFPMGTERLYQLGAAKSTAFHDIANGNSGNGTTPGYAAIAGYDLATGWGTPNLPQLIGSW